MPILFLSHSGSDTEAAKTLKQRIEDSPTAKEAGLKVWFDRDDLKAGKTWQAQLETKIDEADAFAVFVGARGVVNWVEAEVELAISRATKSPEFPFIPIIAKESEGSNALPAFARRYHGVRDPLNDSGELSKLIKAATGGDWDRQVILTDEPFIGLRSMDESWANRFFGRKGEVRELVDKFKKHRLVADSGAGKSSLAQAGLVPAFRGGALADESRDEPEDKIWHVIIMRPGNDPVQGLKDGITDAAKLLGMPGDEQSRLRERLKISDVGESAYALRCDLDRKSTETLLIIDQFEELLIQTREEKRAPFVDFLCGLADGPFGFRILLTLRADYFNFDDSLQKLRSRLWADGQDAVFRLKRMSDQALAETAREPLDLVGFRNQAAVDALIREIQRDVSDREGDLALVQMALHSVWRRHKNQSEDLLQAYAEVQGVSGALAHEAEKVCSKLNDVQLALLFPILARVIRRGEMGGATRRIAQRDEFDPEKQKLIAHLSSEDGGRLLLASDSSVEIAHEALITQWPWLRTKGENFASDLVELSRLMDKAKAWAKEPLGSRPKFLATGAELEAFSAMAARHKNWLSDKEHEFVYDSNKAHRITRQNMRAMRATVGVLAVGVVAVFIAGLQPGDLVRHYVTRLYMIEQDQPHVLTAERERALKPKESFKECAKNCPEMVVVQPGHFIMGSPATEPGREADEGPQHSVTIVRRFAVSEFEVTFAEWDACVSVGGCPPASDNGEGRDTRPVINITWDEAQKYVAWFSNMTDRQYRLLSEAEWEYAARAGTTTAYTWGDEIGQGMVNCNGCGGQFDRKTAPVGSYRPNAFRLYDMHGNVWEWVEDCYHNDYNGAPIDGSAWMIGDCKKHVIRGGSLYDLPQGLRGARRNRYEANYRTTDLGFRIARTLAP
jgi:formylglycine-generating enzyme required for sulfatase activity